MSPTVKMNNTLIMKQTPQEVFQCQMSNPSRPPLQLEEGASGETANGMGRKRRRTSCVSVSYSDVTDAAFLRMLESKDQGAAPSPVVSPAPAPRGGSGGSRASGKRQRSSTPQAKPRPPPKPAPEQKVGQVGASTLLDMCLGCMQSFLDLTQTQ